MLPQPLGKEGVKEAWERDEGLERGKEIKGREERGNEERPPIFGLLS